MTSFSGRYVKVQSLYGPGTVGAWLLTTISVLVSWTLNKKSRRKDTLSLDLVTTLLLPVIAAIHLFYLLVHLPVSIKEALTSQDENILELVAAFEAPLNVCETYSILSLVLAICCGTWPEPPVRLKRLTLTLLTGLLTWTPENVLFVTATLKGVRPDESILGGPYLFQFGPLVEAIWAWIATTTTLAAAFIFISAITSRQRPRVSNDSIAIREMRNRTPDMHVISTEPYSSVSLAAVLTCMIFTPFSGLGLALPFGRTRGPARQPFFIPQSTASIQDSDQALAFGTGGLVLLNSALSAWKSGKSPSTHTIAKPYAGRRRSI
jgi:hypothetical protein